MSRREIDDFHGGFEDVGRLHFLVLTGRILPGAPAREQIAGRRGIAHMHQLAVDAAEHINFSVGHHGLMPEAAGFEPRKLLRLAGADIESLDGAERGAGGVLTADDINVIAVRDRGWSEARLAQFEVADLHERHAGRDVHAREHLRRFATRLGAEGQTGTNEARENDNAQQASDAADGRRRVE